MSELASLRLGFAFSAGVATFFAPCAYPLLPGYVAFYLGDAASDASAGVRLRRAGVVAALISSGMLVVYAALAVVVALVGTRPLSNLAVLELVVGAGLVVLGGAVAADPIGHPSRRRLGEAIDDEIGREEQAGARLAEISARDNNNQRGAAVPLQVKL